MIKEIDISNYQDLAMLIIEDSNSSYKFANQVGGTCCWWKTCQGVMIPFPWLNFRVRDPFYELWSNNLTPERVQSFLCKFNIDDMLIPREVACEGGEAWIPVIVNPSYEGCWDIYQFRGLKAILTYENSD